MIEVFLFLKKLKPFTIKVFLFFKKKIKQKQKRLKKTKKSHNLRKYTIKK